jgi:UDP-2,3-diacylglucosamine pyrophosphatase LpxH
MSKTIILSDLHLGALNAQTSAQLAILHSDFDRLILNGDTVDHYDFRRFTPDHWAVLNRLRAVARERELIVVRGNHDWKGALTGDPNAAYRLLEHVLQARLVDYFELSVGQRSYLVLHGDQFDTTMNLSTIGDAADYFYRHVQQVSRGAARWLKAASKLVCGVVEQVKQKACARAQALGHAGAIVGHTHFCCDEMVAGVHYLNCGCWVEQPCSYVAVEDGDIALCRWPAPAEAPVLFLPPRPSFAWPAEATYAEAV